MFEIERFNTKNAKQYFQTINKIKNYLTYFQISKSKNQYLDEGIQQEPKMSQILNISCRFISKPLLTHSIIYKWASIIQKYNNLKMQTLKAAISILFLLSLASSLSIKSHDGSIAEYCWRDSYGRGVGTIPSVCPSNKDKIGLLCYSKCPSGYSRFGFDCHQGCPTGWSNQGLFCRLSEYGRGAGYPWKVGDGFNDKGMVKRCEAKHGKGNCEKDGAIYYPKCRSGYHNFGCCICRPNTPNCKDLGFSGGIDLSCAKKIIIGDPKSMGCVSSQDYDAGLCYDKCKNGFSGAGPVCWGTPPTGWVNCGMGAATDSKTCAETTFDEVSSVGNLALNIATFGAGKAATMSTNSADAAKLKQQYEQLKKLQENSEAVQDLISKGQGQFPEVEAGKSTGELLQADPDTLTPEDMVRVAAQIAALADPTGAADVVAAYTYPKCNDIQV